MRKQSPKGKLEAELDGLFKKVLIQERGLKDEIQVKTSNCLTVFHVLSKNAHPRLRYDRVNCLLTEWEKIHAPWHTAHRETRIYDYIDNRIKNLRGEDYSSMLLSRERELPRHTTSHLKELKKEFQEQLKEQE